MVLLRQTFQGPVPFLDAFWATGESQGVHLGTQRAHKALSFSCPWCLRSMSLGAGVGEGRGGRARKDWWLSGGGHAHGHQKCRVPCSVWASPPPLPWG